MTTASVQYDDWTGTVAMDNSDGQTIYDYLRSKNALSQDERVVGFRFYLSETRSQNDTSLKLSLCVTKNGNQEPVWQEEGIQISPDDFMNLFKRFAFIASLKGRELPEFD